MGVRGKKIHIICCRQRYKIYISKNLLIQRKQTNNQKIIVAWKAQFVSHRKSSFAKI